MQKYKQEMNNYKNICADISEELNDIKEKLDKNENKQ